MQSSKVLSSLGRGSAISLSLIAVNNWADGGWAPCLLVQGQEALS